MTRRRRHLWPGLRRLESVPAEDCGGASDGDDVASPCTGACRLGAGGVCLDCRRTLQEIASWSTLSVQGKRDVVAAALRRERGTAEPGDVADED